MWSFKQLHLCRVYTKTKTGGKKRVRERRKSSNKQKEDEEQTLGEQLFQVTLLYRTENFSR